MRINYNIALCLKLNVMKKQVAGIIFGTLAGILDVIPMIKMKLTWDANISAFVMWVIIGFLISVVDLKMHSIIKGILISYLVLFPTAILISWNDRAALMPIVVTTAVLGGLLGFTISKITKNE